MFEETSPNHDSTLGRLPWLDPSIEDHIRQSDELLTGLYRDSTVVIAEIPVTAPKYAGRSVTILAHEPLDLAGKASWDIVIGAIDNDADEGKVSMRLARVAEGNTAHYTLAIADPSSEGGFRAVDEDDASSIGELFGANTSDTAQAA